MKKCMSVFLLPIILAACLQVLSCGFSNDADIESPDYSLFVREITGVAFDEEADVNETIGVIIKKLRPVDAWACCFARQTSNGRIHGSLDLGPFNSYGDFRPADLVLDGRTDTWWQATYSSATAANNNQKREHDDDNWDFRHWVMIDLGADSKASVLKLHSHKANTTNYQVFAHADRDELMLPHPLYNDEYAADQGLGSVKKQGSVYYWDPELGQYRATSFSIDPVTGEPVEDPTAMVELWDAARVNVGRAGGLKSDGSSYNVPKIESRVATGTLDGENGEKAIVLSNDSVRYVMLRTQVAAYNADRTIDELWCESWTIKGNAPGDFNLYKVTLAKVYAASAAKVRNVSSVTSKAMLERLVYGIRDTDGTLFAEGAKQFMEDVVLPGRTAVAVMSEQELLERQIAIDKNVTEILNLLYQIEFEN